MSMHESEQGLALVSTSMLLELGKGSTFSPRVERLQTSHLTLSFWTEVKSVTKRAFGINKSDCLPRLDATTNILNSTIQYNGI